MNQNNRPHSRQKTVGSGSAGVGKGRKVGSGAPRPVGGSGGRFGSPSGGSSPRRGVQRGLINPKMLLILVAVAVVIGLASRCGGGGLSSMMGDLSGLSGSNGDYSGYQEDHGSSEGSGGYTSQQGSTPEPVDFTVAAGARDKRVELKGDGNDTVTVMIYMCGTDLESKHGMATRDLKEMISADISDKVNVIVETGGCSKWQNSAVSSSVNQIYRVRSGGLEPVEENFGTALMTDPKNLASFIDYCEEHYPADRNMLILWDHGGGSISGFGYDEKSQKPSPMTLSLISSALDTADCTFDVIGFDACLMATLETALVCGSHADYLLASEESEPGTGWYYTGWLNELSENTSIPTVRLAKTVIDDFVASSTQASPGAKVTLSLIDLAELEGTVPQDFRDFAVSVNGLIAADNYAQVSNARAGVRQFAQSSRINQVDLVDLAERIGTDESLKLVKTLRSCVKYNRSTISRCYGVSIYFPYETTGSVKSAIASYNAIGFDSEYTRCIQSFASLEYGGQIAGAASQYPSQSVPGGDLLGSLISGYSSSGASTSPIDALLGGFLGYGGNSSAGNSIDPDMIAQLLGDFSGRSMPENYDWVDTGLIAQKSRSIANGYLNPARLTPTEKGGRDVLSLTEDEWKLIQTVELNVFVEDSRGYIDLGLDNTFDWYGDDLLLEYDGTWLTINGNVCAYYLVSDTRQEDGSWTTIGRIPALLNGEFVNLQVVFDKANPQGAVIGACPLYQDELIGVQAKDSVEIVAGDEIELLCDYYDLDGTCSDTYTLGTGFKVPQSGLKLENLRLDVDDVDVMYRLTDIYGNHYWVEGDD